MYLYTESHILVVFLLGILNGVLGVFVVQEVKTGYRVSKLVVKIILRAMLRPFRKRIMRKTKVPTASTVSTL